MIKDFELFLKLNESVNDLPVCITTNNGIDAIEFEDYLHKNDYIWTGGSKYILKNIQSYDGILFVSFNKEEKTFTGYDLKTTPPYFIRDKMEQYEYKLKYPENIRDIDRFIRKVPSYKPRKIVR